MKLKNHTSNNERKAKYMSNKNAIFEYEYIKMKKWNNLRELAEKSGIMKFWKLKELFKRRLNENISKNK